jgi:uncharacterized protein YbbK (DUF523 family)
MSGKIKIGISSCLLGNNVRYDGGNRLDQTVIDALGPFVEWVPVCPEVESGLPVPREAMHLVQSAESRRMITICTSVDHTEQVMQWVERELADLENQGLCGFVFKARSPSCAITDAEICTPSGTLINKGPGIFAKMFMARFPSIPVVDEESLQDSAVRGSFLERVSLYAGNHV